MAASPLLSTAALSALDDVTLLDVRWDVGVGARADLFEQGHIPGAAFVDLDRELSAPPGAGGRHPLPAPGEFEAAMRRAGVSERRPVVVYDGANSSAAARAWWLLRYFGHEDVRVLDGGLAAWAAGGGALERGPARPREPADFTARPGQMLVLDAAGAAELARHGLLLDARATERFRGESEPIDPVAGHIPGARNRPTTENVEPSGAFRGPAELQAAFEAVGAAPGVAVGAYCGSGVTAAHEVLALTLAGIDAALYPGSWSEWIRDPSRPVATGQ